MALTADKFIITNGAPVGNVQLMQSATVGPSDLITKVATSATTFGKAMVSGELVLLEAQPATLYRLTQTALSSESLDDVTKDPISLDIAGTSTTSALLETTYPAASNNARWGLVAGTTAQNGFYLSNGSAWVKQLDNSGDRTNLFNYAGGLTDDVTDIISGGTVYLVESDLTTALNIFGGNVASNAFDSNDGTFAWMSDTSNNAGNRGFLYSIMGAPKIARKFILKLYSDTAPTTVGIYGFTSGSPDVATALTISSINQTTGSGATFSGSSLNNLSASDVIEITTTNSSSYDGYGIKLGTGANEKYVSYEAYELIDNTDTVDCVSAITLLHAGVQASEAIATATTLDNTHGLVLVSGVTTITLDNPTTIEAGKIYRIKKMDATNLLTIDPQTYTIDGSTTDITTTTQYDWIELYNTGTEYIKLGSKIT